MTSAEFAAKYRVLKTLTEHGARTQIAQEVALGRMVMVHHLDVGTTEERQSLVAKVGRLTPDAAAKVFDVVTVGDMRVIVTHFLATFTDLPSWLEVNSASADPSEAKTVLMEAPELPPPPSASGGFTSVFGASALPPVAAPEVTQPSAADSAAPSGAPSAGEGDKGSFTEIFAGPKPAAPRSGKRSTPRTPTPRVAPPVAPPAETPSTAPSSVAEPPVAAPPGDFTRVFQGGALQTTDPRRPTTPPPPAAPTSPPAAPPPVVRRPSDQSFTSVFGAKPPVSDAPPPALRAPGVAAPAPSGPPALNAARFGSVMPPVEPPPPPRPAPAPPPAASINSTSEDFNALFARLDPAGSAQPPAPPALAAPTFPAPSAAPSAPPSPNLGGPPPGISSNPGVPSLARMIGGAAPPPPARGPSEFTRVLGRQTPPMSPPAARLPDPSSSAPGLPTPGAPQPQAPPPAEKTTKSYLPMIIALNFIVIGAIIVVVYFVLKH